MKLPDLSDDQWDFLSLLHAFGTPISIDIAGSLAPISPGRFLDLLGRNDKPGFIHRVRQENYYIVPEWLPKLDNHLTKINTQKRLNEIVDRLYHLQLIDQVDFSVLERLISKLGQNYSSGELEISLAEMAMEKKDKRGAANILASTVTRLAPFARNPEVSQLFIRAVIMLSSLWYFSGGNLKEMISHIEKALKVSMSTGDKRSHAILNLYLSSYYEFIGKKEDMWNAFSAGYQGVKELGDSDILSRTASLLATNLIMQGLYAEAQPHFERKLPSISLNKTPEEPLMERTHNIFQYGTCLMFQGKIREAVGFLQYCRNLATEPSEPYGKIVTKNVLAVSLLIIRRVEPAKEILQKILREVKQNEYNYAYYLVYFNLSYAYFLEGRFEEAIKIIAKASAIGEKLGTVRFPMADYILEMLFELDGLGIPSDPRFNYRDQLQQVLKGRNVDLKGTALRLEALAVPGREKASHQIEKYLISSEKYLEQSGNSIQLGKTYLERVRLYLNKNDETNAALYAEKAYTCFGEYARIFFPEDLMQWLTSHETFENREKIYQQRFNLILDAYDAISISVDEKESFFRCLQAISRITGAERAGIFRFEKNKKSKTIQNAVLYNLTQKEIKSPMFSHGKALVMQALNTQKSCIERNDDKGNHLFEVRSLCCIPIEVDSGQQCVLYLDNTFFDDHYDELDISGISKLISKAISHLRQLSENRINAGHIVGNDRGNVIEAPGHDQLKTENPTMLALIEKADKIASTESTVLITGETGTGKELLSQRVHDNSPRKNNPFVVVDLTAIPESLLESELFGHEKGAFTGADRQKTGRIELAHQGTLFLDEIGEVPLAFQVKLLRLLQEKKISRIGGAKTISVDFRLIAATNRNLEKEVAAGRFRQDLYYRLNVVPITLPPLRERQNDIIVLAQHFLSKFQKRYNKSGIQLTPEDKTWLMTYHWPGNVRELKNIIERSVIMSKKGLLNLSLTPSPISAPLQVLPDTGQTSTGFGSASIPVGDYPTLEEVQRRYFKLVLEKTNGKMTGPGGASGIIGMKPSSMYNRMRKLGLR